MEKIKQTKSIKMMGDEKVVTIYNFNGTDDYIIIPMKSVFQVKRGLESYVARFYRKGKSKRK